MANGAGSPDCWNCRFVVIVEDRKECSKHNFIIPKGGSEKICKDWQDEKHTSHHFNELLPGILYYYSYASKEPPTPLDQFEHFKKQVEYISLNLVYDTEFGWSLYCKNENKEISYDAHGTVSIILDGSSFHFEVAEATRLFYGLQDDGTCKRGWSKGLQKIIYCPSDPVILYKWLNKQFDVEAILYKFSHARSMLYTPTINLFILCEPNRTENALHLKPNFSLYGELARKPQGKG